MKILFFVFSFVSSFLLSFHFYVHAVFNWFLPVVLFLFVSLLNLILLFLFMFLVVLVLHVVPSIPLVPAFVSCFVHVFIFSFLAIARIVLCLSFAFVLSSFPFSDQFSFYVSLSFHLVFSVFLRVSSHVSFFFHFLKMFFSFSFVSSSPPSSRSLQSLQSLQSPSSSPSPPSVPSLPSFIARLGDQPSQKFGRRIICTSTWEQENMRTNRGLEFC